jgi:hypothetical protein
MTERMVEHGKTAMEMDFSGAEDRVVAEVEEGGAG